ncbi:membrane-associating domain-containing protein [Lineolata rhizophorae]|uniref:Membrane-associating domain-containing protein n=1 Tax=Lineolata rhizophorae TaxID=578093 RepID=A0A6A6PEE9_9PEZI|nr:membrane-associating domain-containing protein [Lineolata rhizophorae]
MAFNFILPLRIAQAVFAVVILGLSAFVSDWWNFQWRSISPTEVNFLIFSSVWTILALAYLVVAPWRFPVAAHKFAILGVECLTMLFWFAGFIAIAVFLTDRDCFGSVCSAAKAGIVFAAFEWLVFAATSIMAIVHVWRTRKSGGEKGPSPEMRVSPHSGT